MTEHSFSRRSFLTRAVALGSLAAAAAVTGCAPKQPDEPSAEGAAAESAAVDGKPAWLVAAPAVSDGDCVETIDTDVLVIGAGTAGYFAACAAAEKGVKTLLIEKSGNGNSVRSSALGAVNSRLQQAEGEKAAIDPMEIVNDMDRYANGQVSVPLLKKWALNSGEALDWYTDLLTKNGMEVQLEWNMPEGTFYKDFPTGHGTNGEYPSREADVAKIMDAYIASFPECEVRFNTPMVDLIAEDGRVVGAYAEGPDGMVRINAAKGVVVATGGYAFNQDMFADRHATRYACNGTMDAFPSCTGDGILALLRLGAYMDENPSSVSFNRCLLTADQEVGTPYEIGGEDYGYHFYASQPFLRVDAHGRRFHNESAPYDFVQSAISRKPAGERYWHQVWDGNWKNDVPRFHTVVCSTIYMQPEGGSDHDAFPDQLDIWIEPEMEQFVADGRIVKADTLDALADALGFTGEDKETFRLSELRTPPFYASVKSCGFTLCTTDGVVVNEDLQPLHEDGSVIEGVYAVGNDGGCFCNGTYPNLAAGLNAGKCATFGRMVGKALAEK